MTTTNIRTTTNTYGSFGREKNRRSNWLPVIKLTLPFVHVTRIVQLLLCTLHVQSTIVPYLQTPQFYESYKDLQLLLPNAIYFSSCKFLYFVGQKGHHKPPPLIPLALGVSVHVITRRSPSRSNLTPNQYPTERGG